MPISSQGALPLLACGQFTPEYLRKDERDFQVSRFAFLHGVFAALELERNRGRK